MKTTELFSLEHTLMKDYLLRYLYPWQALFEISSEIIALGRILDKREYYEIKKNLWVHKSAVLNSKEIFSPCIIGENTEIRSGAFIRGSAIIGKNCVVGNSTEIKNSILFDNVQVPHFNYIGDSILGYKAHLGAGAVTSNVKSDKSTVFIKSKRCIDTERKKVGAFLGDEVEVGCNSVLCPGTVIGKNTTVYPLSLVRGTVPENSIYKSFSCVVRKDNFNG